MLKYIFIIIALSCVIYLNTLNNAFVSDDIPAIVNNPDIAHIFHNRNSPAFLNSLNYLIAKLNPVPYHLANIILHSLNSILVFFFLLLFFRQGPAFWGSLIFATHPIHTEAVTWISGRPYSLLTFFVLSSFLLYVSATAQSKLKMGKLFSSLVMFVFVLSLSPAALFFPVILVLYDFCFRKDWKKNWKLWLIFFIPAVLSILFIRAAIKYRVVTVAQDTGSAALTNPIFNMAYSIFSHLSLLIWPKNLTLYHEPYIISRLGIGLETFFLVLIILSLPLIFKKARVVFFAVCFFVLFLAPTYSPVTISWLVAERYLYLPSVAFSIFAAFLISKYSRTIKSKRLINIILIFLVALYSLRTIIRNFDWRSHASIWRVTVKTSPLSPRAHNNMGDVYSQEGNLEKAAQEFMKAIELKPNYADAQHNLAYTYQKMGKIEEATINYKRALNINPSLYQSYQNLGVIYFNLGQKQKAEEYFSKAEDIRKVK